MMDVDQVAKEIMAEIEDFIDGFNQPTYRGMRINGVRVPVLSSRSGLNGRPDTRYDCISRHDSGQAYRSVFSRDRSHLRFYCTDVKVTAGERCA